MVIIRFSIIIIIITIAVVVVTCKKIIFFSIYAAPILNIVGCEIMILKQWSITSFPILLL